MLTIRLQRVGKTKYPTYRLIISEKGRDTHDKYLEAVGVYNPHEKENRAVIKAERVKYWMGKGAQLSNTVFNLLVKNGVLEGKKRKSVYLSDSRKQKMAEKSGASKPAEAKPTAEASKAETALAPATAVEEAPAPVVPAAAPAA